MLWHGSPPTGFEYMAGLEVEFHLFKIEDLRLDPARLAWPAEPPAVSLTTHGFQYLTESRFDQVDPIMKVLRKTMIALGLPLRSLEVELGPSQYEFTFAPTMGLAPADMMVSVPQRHEADGSAKRLSRQLHVPAAHRTGIFERLAFASVVGGQDIESEPVCIE